MTSIIFNDTPNRIIQEYKESIGQPSMTDDEAFIHACKSGASILPDNDISRSCFALPEIQKVPTPRTVHKGSPYRDGDWFESCKPDDHD